MSRSTGVLELASETRYFYLTPAAESRFRMAQDLRQNLGLRAIYSDKEISDMLKYYGGRTEAYYAHAENAYDLDVNSLYPYVMCNSSIQP